MRNSLIAFTLLILASCGAEQSILSTQATIVHDTQPTRFTVYEREHARCLGVSVNFDAYQGCMEPARAVARGADAYRAALEAAQATLNASGEAAFADMLPCLVEVAQALLRALEAVDAPIPSEVGEIAAMLSSGECHD